MVAVDVVETAADPPACPVFGREEIQTRDWGYASRVPFHGRGYGLYRLGTHRFSDGLRGNRLFSEAEECVFFLGVRA